MEDKTSWNWDRIWMKTKLTRVAREVTNGAGNNITLVPYIITRGFTPSLWVLCPKKILKKREKKENQEKKIRGVIYVPPPKNKT